MGEESIRAGSSVPDVNDDSAQSTSNSSQSGGVEVQHLSISGESGSEGSSNNPDISLQPQGPSETRICLESNGLGWAIVQLTEVAESVPVKDVERDLRRVLSQNGVQLFFPAISRQGTFIKDNPYANYVFVSSTLSDTKVLKLENSRFVDSVLCIPGSAGRWRTITKLTDEELREAVSLPTYSGIPEGAEVRVISGEWQGIEGMLLNSFGNQVKVSLQLRSRRRILVLAREEIVQI